MIANIAEIAVAVLLVASGVLAIGAAFGLLRLPDYFQRMHAPSVVTTLATWLVSLASIVHFSFNGGLQLHAWLIAILLAITGPVTTVLLARVGLFRGRRAGDDMPAPLPGQQESA